MVINFILVFFCSWLLFLTNSAWSGDFNTLKYYQQDPEQFIPPPREIKLYNSIEEKKKRRLLEKRMQILGKTRALSEFEQVYLDKYLWTKGSTLRVCFFDGNPKAWDHFFELFKEIVTPINLDVDTTHRRCLDSSADIQVKFISKYYSSLYGKNSKKSIQKSPHIPTMRLKDAYGPTWLDREDGSIRHEIMHALGAVHEHQHPDSNCEDEIDIELLKKSRFFHNNEEKNNAAIRRNIYLITKKYDRDDLKVFPFDDKSIMHYRIDSKYLKKKEKYNCGFAKAYYELSMDDKKFLKEMYGPSH